MFTSFDESEFWKAIQEKDYTSLKINTVSSMRNDPTFARGETEKVLAILDDKIPEIFEEEVQLDYEERLEHGAWDKRYFTKLTYWFQENFAKSRVGYIKEVGQAVHQDTAQKYNESINRRPAQPVAKQASGRQGGQTATPTKAPAAKRKKLSILKGIVVIVALVLAVVLLGKHLSELVKFLSETGKLQSK